MTREKIEAVRDYLMDLECPIPEADANAVCDLALKGLLQPEAGGKADELRMQIGYLATRLMVKGDHRTLPEIVKEAEDACRPQRE